MKSISIVIPLYNEKESLPELYEGLTRELTTRGGDFEIIFVDDGSVDGSFPVLQSLQQKDPRIKIIRFRRNFGKSSALSAGFRLASGDFIVTMDADLQDRPSEIHKLLAKLDEGCDLVSGWKQQRQDPVLKRITSRLFNFVTSFLTGVPLHDINCGFKAYRRRVIEEIKVYGEMHRYIPVLASYRGFRVDEIHVEHRARAYGKSKYGPARFLGGFFDLLTVIMLTRYNSKPLHIFGILGLILLSVGSLIEVYLTIGWCIAQFSGGGAGMWIEDRPAFMLGILLIIIGVQFIFFGLLAEMIAYSTRREEDYAIQDMAVIETERFKRAVDR
ncbi:MAG: glycosyltransferase family 2 protein [Acidobacteriota bacterium]